MIRTEVVLLVYLLFLPCSRTFTVPNNGASCRRNSETSAAVDGCSLQADQDAVREQLGYLPSNFYCVSARNRNGKPIAIQTYPLDGGAPRRQAKATRHNNLIEESTLSIGVPFPTLYWLTCPEIRRAIGEMERQGFVRVLQDAIQQDAVQTQQLFQCHKEYAQERWQSLTRHHRQALQFSSMSSMKRIQDMLQLSGIAGTNITTDDSASFVASIKCLHAHYADFCSQTPGRTENPVGRLVHERLVTDFPWVTL